MKEVMTSQKNLFKVTEFISHSGRKNSWKLGSELNQLIIGFKICRIHVYVGRGKEIG